MIPSYAEKFWLINETDEAITSEPPVPSSEFWQQGISVDRNANNELACSTDEGNVTITWQFDQPFQETGVYQIFVLDTLKHSSIPVVYSIFE